MARVEKTETRNVLIIKGQFVNGHPFYAEVKQKDWNAHEVGKHYLGSTSDGAFLDESSLTFEKKELTETTVTEF